MTRDGDCAGMTERCFPTPKKSDWFLHRLESRNPAYKARASRSFRAERGAADSHKLAPPPSRVCTRSALYLRWIPAPVQAKGKLCFGQAVRQTKAKMSPFFQSGNVPWGETCPRGRGDCR